MVILRLQLTLFSRLLGLRRTKFVCILLSLRFSEYTDRSLGCHRTRILSKKAWNADHSHDLWPLAFALGIGCSQENTKNGLERVVSTLDDTADPRHDPSHINLNKSTFLKKTILEHGRVTLKKQKGS